MQLPIGVESDFVGIIDLVGFRAIKWRDETLGAEFDIVEVPPDMVEEAKAFRTRLVEAAVEQDDAALEAYLGGEEPSEDVLKRCIRKGTIGGVFVPVLCGSAFKNKGVQPLLDAVVDYLPAPTDVAAINGIRVGSKEPVVRRCSDDEPFAGLAFKIMSDPFVGSLTFVRIYSGVVTAGSQVLNSVKGTRERVGRMLQMHANHREDIKEARAGDIVALAGLKNTTTGDTLSDPGDPVVLERMEFPEPVIEIAVEPKTKGDQEKMSQALARLATEDPSFRVTRRPRERPDRDQGDGRIAPRDHRRPHEARVQGRRQCRRAAGRLPRDDYPHVRSRLHSQEADRRRRASSPASNCGSSRCRRAPALSFENAVVGGAVPKEYVPGVEKGLKASTETGVLAGFPVIDLQATLIDGAFHDVDSSVLAFEIAARAAFKEGVMKAAPKLLEPIMRVEVVTPEEYMGDVIGDLNSRRGQVTGMDTRGNARVIDAMVPLANMFGYVNTLRSMSQGRAQYTMHFRPLRAGAAGGGGRSPRQNGLITQIIEA